MENTYSIYKFTFSDGKTYIGQTEKPVQIRWNNGEGYKEQEVYIPIVLEGWDNIQKEILHTNLSKEQANKLEKYYIKKFNSIINGYNRTDGGSGYKKNKIQKELEQKEILKEKIKLEQELNKKLLSFGNKNNPNRLLTFTEIQEYAKSCPDMEIIIDWKDFGLHISTCKEWGQSDDVYAGGIGHYTYSFLVDWRIWVGNPDIKTILSNPWLKSQEVFDYNKLFVKDEKVRKYITTHNEFPATFMLQFSNYYNDNK